MIIFSKLIHPVFEVRYGIIVPTSPNEDWAMRRLGMRSNGIPSNLLPTVTKKAYSHLRMSGGTLEDPLTQEPITARNLSQIIRTEWGCSVSSPSLGTEEEWKQRLLRDAKDIANIDSRGSVWVDDRELIIPKGFISLPVHSSKEGMY